ncbi:MAG: 3'(2'),5'-bisphosphate nucleotidase [Myxococcota bacterium]
MSDYANELSVALAAVREASKVCRTVQATIAPDALEKKDKSPVTVADFASQALVCRALQSAFPADPVIGEEDAGALRGDDGAAFRKRVFAELEPFGVGSEDDALAFIDRGGANESSSRFWTLDPIDGTKGFLRGDQYAVALALVVDGALTVAALACPNLPCGEHTGTVFWAVKGQGAFHAPLDAEGTQHAARVSTRDDVTQTRLCESYESGHSSHDHSAQVMQRLGITADPVRLDSQTKYGVVARGDAEVYLRLPTRPGYREKIWDHGAGVLIVQEAGGTVTDVAGKPLDFTHGRELAENRGVIVTHGPFHDQILATLKAIGVQ